MTMAEQTVPTVDGSSATLTDTPTAFDRARRTARNHWLLATVLIVFFAAAIWVDVLTPVATTDDWGYSRSSEILLDSHHLEIFPVVAATAVFQVVWGALFAAFFDNNLGAVRLSTLVMVSLGGIALYDICLRLRVSRGRSALVVAAALFNPLAYVLSYTFMTDPHFAAVMTIAIALTLRGVEAGKPVSIRWLIAGSLASAAAVLIRQQGVLIPLGIALFFLLRGDLRVSWLGLRRLLAIGLIPAIAFFGYLAWLRLFNGVPDVQQEFASEIKDAGIQGSGKLIASLSFFELMYTGLFVLPITAASLLGIPTLVRGWRGNRVYGWAIAGVWILSALAGIYIFADTRRRMPYIPQFLGSGGLGPPDVRGGRPRLFEQPIFNILTAVCLISTILLALWVARALSSRSGELRDGAGLVIAVLAGQVVGVVLPSYHYIDRGYSLDRYLLPMLPLILALAAWALTDVTISIPTGWIVVVAFGLFAAVGTRDYLQYMDAVWKAADYAVEAGARPDQIDAGAAWDGYHLYTYGEDQGIERARTRDGPWWTYFYGKATDSTYVVSSRPLRGYVRVAVFPYASSLQDEPMRLYLLKRFWAPWPPPPHSG